MFCDVSVVASLPTTLINRETQVIHQYQEEVINLDKIPNHFFRLKVHLTEEFPMNLESYQWTFQIFHGVDKG